MSDFSITPMMEQYFNSKRKYPNCLVLFQMGDFFEAFYQDAEYAAHTLNILLTKRGKNGGQDIPMCGVPIHSYVNYVKKLVLSGKQIALCKQIETPNEAKSEGRSIVKREVVKIITRSNMCYELDDVIEENNYLLALSFIEDRFFCHYLDISTEEFSVYEDYIVNLKGFLMKIDPVEILIKEEKMKKHIPMGFEAYEATTDYDKNIDIPENLKIYRKNIPSEYQDSFSIILAYLYNTKTKIPTRIPSKDANQFKVYLSSSTIEKLNLVSHRLGTNNTVYKILNYTKTPMGKRLLRSRLLNPTNNVILLNRRFDIVESIIKNFLRKKIEIKWPFVDIKKLLVKIVNNHYNTCDLYCFAQNIETAITLCDSVASITNCIYKVNINDMVFSHLTYNKETGSYDYIYETDGNLGKLKRTKQILLNSINFMVSDYIQKTGIVTLKLRSNDLVGMYLEIPLSQKYKIPSDFLMRQTLTKSIRYVTSDLLVQEQKLNELNIEIEEAENQIKTLIRDKIFEKKDALEGIINFIGETDLYFSFAKAAYLLNLRRPIFSEEHVFKVKKGRHIIVEKNLIEKKLDDFVSNDLTLDDKNKVAIITGPNMGGKSTYLKQNALIILLAHIGCFVPAEEAIMRKVDGIYTRIGAEDDIIQGKSTFFVEMEELQNILQNSTEYSFIILDEIGRGTSLVDGLPIAVATIEYVRDKIKAMCLFATHFLEIHSMKKDGIIFLKSDYILKNDQLILLHQIEEGVAQSAFGINIAKLAGLPPSLIERAQVITAKSHIEIKLVVE